MITLALDAATYVGTVCVARGSEVLLARAVAMRDPHSERLMPAVASVLGETGLSISGVDRIVCGEGPGSFTSLRIAASIAKGLALAADRPLWAVSSLALMVASVEPPLGRGEYLAVLDALRGEWYATTCSVGEGGEVTDAGDVSLIGADELTRIVRRGGTVIGDGRGAKGAPHARGIVRAAPLLERRGPVDLSLWEPHYGRLAEAQRRWEVAHGRPLSDA